MERIRNQFNTNSALLFFFKSNRSSSDKFISQGNSWQDFKSFFSENIRIFISTSFMWDETRDHVIKEETSSGKTFDQTLEHGRKRQTTTKTSKLATRTKNLTRSSWRTAKRSGPSSSALPSPWRRILAPLRLIAETGIRSWISQRFAPSFRADTELLLGSPASASAEPASPSFQVGTGVQRPPFLPTVTPLLSFKPKASSFTPALPSSSSIATPFPPSMVPYTSPCLSFP